MLKRTFIESDEVYISETVLKLFHFEVDEDIIYKDGLRVFINGRSLKMIKKGENIIGENESLFRPTKSSLLAEYLLQELFYVDDDISIYTLEDVDFHSTRIYGKDRVLLAKGDGKTPKESIIHAIFKFYFGDNSIYYTSKMNFDRF